MAGKLNARMRAHWPAPSETAGFGGGRGGLTLMEMMVAVSILAVVVLCIGVIFQSTSNAVGTSEALLEMMGNARAIEDQMSRDVASIDKDGFLVIRSTHDPVTGERFDQMSFLALGSFSDPMDAGTTASAAHVWWGELSMMPDSAPASQTTPVPLLALPTLSAKGEYTLGRHVMLLMAKSSANPPGTFAHIGYVDTNVAAIAGEPPAHITSSRFNVAATTPSQVMAWIRTHVSGRPSPFEADHYCYRFNALPNVYASQISIVNGYSRMTPVTLQGVTDFRIEWTPGGSGDMVWYGATNPMAAAGQVSLNEPVTSAPVPPTNPPADDYVAIFSFDTARSDWPSALRVTFRLTDPNGRLQGGRTFTQVMKLPD